MKKNQDAAGSIMLIDDDLEDLSIFTDAFNLIKPENKLLMFDNPNSAIELLLSTEEKPFLILCDINLGQIDAFSFRNHLLSCDSTFIAVPFVFFSSAAKQTYIGNLNTQSIQGFFQKPATFSEMVDILKSILHYWDICRLPDLQVQK